MPINYKKIEYLNTDIYNTDIYKAPVSPESGLRRPGLSPGNCLSALGTVRTAATMDRLKTTQRLFIIELILSLRQRRSLRCLEREFWPTSNRASAIRQIS